MQPKKKIVESVTFARFRPLVIVSSRIDTQMFGLQVSYVDGGMEDQEESGNMKHVVPDCIANWYQIRSTDYIPPLNENKEKDSASFCLKYRVLPLFSVG